MNIASLAPAGSLWLGASDSFTLRTFVTSPGYLAGPTRICLIGRRAHDLFLDKPEKDVSSRDVKVWKSFGTVFDPEAIASFGGRSEISLAHYIGSLMLLPTGDRGVPFIAPVEVIGYVRDELNVLWALRAGWDAPVWNLYAFAPESERGWRAGRLFLS